MKKKLILTAGLIMTGTIIVFSQIGINTQNPQNVFHIDGAKDNASTGAPTTLQQVNDVIITSQGKMGIGTTSPSGALDVNSTTGALIPPRMTVTERDALLQPPTGAMIFNTTNTQLQTNLGTPNAPVWTALATASTTVNTTVVRAQSAQQNNVSLGSIIALGNLSFDNTGGYITYNSGSFTLKAGKTYKLEFSAGWILANNVTYAQFQWFNSTTNSYIGYSQHMEMAPSVNWNAGGGSSIALISTTSDIVVSPRYRFGGGLLNIVGGGGDGASAYATITILN